MVQAEVGRVELDARLRNAPPEQSPHVDGDITPGLLAVSAISAALFQRERDRPWASTSTSSMAEALALHRRVDLHRPRRLRRPRIPDTWNYPVFTRRRRHRCRVHGRPDRRLLEIAAALSDETVEPTESRDEASRSSRGLVAEVPDFPTLEARMDTFGFLVAEVRTVPDVAETPWAVNGRYSSRSSRGYASPRRRFEHRPEPSTRKDLHHASANTPAVCAEWLGADKERLDELEAAGVVSGSLIDIADLPTRSRRQ